LAWPVLVCTVVCVLTPRPAFADPVATGTTPTQGGSTATIQAGAVPDLSIPDAGAVPAPSAPLAGPSATAAAAPATATPETGPLADQILSKFNDDEAIGQKLTQAGIDVTAAQATTKTTYDVWQQQLADAKDLQNKADSAAAKAYKDAAGLGPLGVYANDMHQLGLLAPGLNDGSRGGGPEGSETAIQDATRAREQAAIDEQAYKAALAHEQDLEGQQASLKTSHDQLTVELTNLHTQNQAAVAQAEARQDAIDRGLAPRFAASSMVGGKAANPKALAALNFAFAQLGKPYVWATEGPSTYDCSGLTWASYMSTGYELPRVANDQFHATQAQEVSPSQLIPGDLLFFSVTSRTDWTTISHVAMYIGDGLMIEAPRTGEVVKIATVWWSAFFGATRVYPSVIPVTPGAPYVPTPTPPPPPPPAPAPPASTTPPASPSPSPQSPPVPTGPPSDTPPPSTTPSPTPTPSDTPSPSTTPSADATASASQSAAANASASQSAAASESAASNASASQSAASNPSAGT
jgi:cell wall-associated NlpC family hydrolase